MTHAFLKNPQQADICATCGTRYPGRRTAADTCPICLDERQYIGDNGQVWTSLEDLARNRSIRFERLSDSLLSLQAVPHLAIGQKAHLILSPSGNMLWDCLPFLDEPTVAYIRSLGGLRAIAISHPHYYSLMTDWADVFDCPIYLHAADRQWVMHPSERIHFWQSETIALWDDMALVQTGGHFAGATILYHPRFGEKGALFTGDSIFVARDRKSVSFMYSYPNMIPLPKKAILQIQERVARLQYDAIYGAFEGQIIPDNAKEAVHRSLLRYLAIFEA
ncbi:MBL fold metallo-hydrolase [Pontibacter liquoris]|uniref:MBL fold metallo-hydrolase n=1 Tax=Pontibacter liquoris TaxID=2905677 RepID=UPI001FA80BD9|nr:MBL fold metallo-hydrolase [Pontibacter liquoris]